MLLDHNINMSAARLLLVSLACAGVQALPSLNVRQNDDELVIGDPSDYNYTIEHPFAIPAKPNGLDVDRPNMILFMPDQLRFDAVGTFGNDVRAI